MSAAASTATWTPRLALAGLLPVLDQGVVSATNFLTVVLVGRFAGKGSLGLYALGFSLLQFALCVQQSLITAPYTVLAGREREGTEYAGSVLVQSALLSLLIALALVAGAVVCLVLGLESFPPLLVVLAVSTPAVLAREFGRRYAFAFLDFGSALVIDLAASALQVGALVGLARVGALDALTAHGAIGVGCAVAGGAWLGLSRRAFVVRRARLAPDLRRNWAFGSWVLASNGTGCVQTFLLDWLVAFLGLSATGLYSSCVALVNVCNPLLQGVGNVAAPRAARTFAADGQPGLQRVVVQTTVLLGLTLGGFTAFLSLFGADLAGLLFGSAFRGLEPIITLLALAALATGAGLGASVGLWAMGRSELNFAASVAALLVSLVAAVVCLPLWGIAGAAPAALAGAVVNSAFKVAAFVRLCRGPAGQPTGEVP